MASSIQTKQGKTITHRKIFQLLANDQLILKDKRTRKDNQNQIMRA